MPNLISNRKLWLIWLYLLKKGKKNYRDIKEILFNKFVHPLHSLKMIFEKSAKFIITYFNTSVIINTIEMVTDTLIFFCRNQKKEQNFQQNLWFCYVRYFCLFFMPGRSVFKKYVECSKFLKRNFIRFYSSFSYYSFVSIHTKSRSI